jgi:hypothetical protein
VFRLVFQCANRMMKERTHVFPVPAGPQFVTSTPLTTQASSTPLSRPVLA